MNDATARRITDPGQELQSLTVPGNVVLFTDPHRKSPKRQGFNQVGVVLPDRVITFIREYKAVEMGFPQLAQLPLRVMKFKEDELTQKVASFFCRYRQKARFIALGLAALQARNYGVFDSIGIMPAFSTIPSQDEHDAAWERVVRKLERGDQVFVFEHKSFIDWLIARLDHGAWSHFAMYIGNGMIIESVPGEGAIMRNLDVYKSRYVHIGIYRDPSLTPEMIERGLSHLERMINPQYEVIATIGRPTQQMIDRVERMNRRPSYNLRGALALGLRKILARLRYGEGAYFVSGMTPNDVIFAGKLRLVDYL